MAPLVCLISRPGASLISHLGASLISHPGASLISHLGASWALFSARIPIQATLEYLFGNMQDMIIKPLLARS